MSRIVFKTAAAPDLDALRVLPAVRDVILTPVPGQPEWQTVALRSADAQTSLRALLNMGGGKAQPLRELRVERATLEDVFLQLTGRRIRE